jgi:rubrerythrin
MVNEVTAVLSQVIREEKRHAAALMKLINKLDDVQSEMFLTGLKMDEHDHDHDDDHAHGDHNSHDHTEHGHAH